MWNNPPTAMVDFLGRRRLCAELPEPGDRSGYFRAEADRLRCASLPEEERTWRDLHAGDATVRAWLDLDPDRFQLNNVRISAWHGPPPADTRRLEQRGVDRQTGQSYHLVIDAGADGGRHTQITASFADLPPRSFTLDNAGLPWLDLQTLAVNLGAQPVRRDQFYVRMRYGHARGYCVLNEEDDRPEISIVFDRERIRASRSETTNCETNWTELPDAVAR